MPDAPLQAAPPPSDLIAMMKRRGLKDWNLTVTGAAQVTPRMRRVSLTAGDLGEFDPKAGQDLAMMLPDGSDGRMRRLRYTGPGAVLIATAHECIEEVSAPVRRLQWRASLTLRELPGRRALSSGQVIALAPGARLLVRSAAAERGEQAAFASGPRTPAAGAGPAVAGE